MGEVLVDVEAVGVNYRDVYEREGHGYGSEPPAVIGVEGAGRIADIGRARRLGRSAGQLRRASGRRPRTRSCPMPDEVAAEIVSRGAAPGHDRPLPGFRLLPDRGGRLGAWCTQPPAAWACC